VPSSCFCFVLLCLLVVLGMTPEHASQALYPEPCPWSRMKLLLSSVRFVQVSPNCISSHFHLFLLSLELHHVYLVENFSYSLAFEFHIWDSLHFQNCLFFFLP
jgi:hypothetical protein